MPSQICHILFADECLQVAFGADGARQLGAHQALYRFAAQGPDFFYHNGFSRPSCRTFGALLHRRRFGTVVRLMAEELAATPNEALRAFVLGFATHASLDRAAHPFIDYFAGWEDPERPETHRYYRCHAFYERIIDVLFLRERRGVATEDYRVADLLDCGSQLPEEVAGALAEALRAAFPALDMTANAEERVQNAYRDAVGFYRFTLRPEFRRQAVHYDTVGPSRRRLALFHPRELPAEIDFLNRSHRRWVHPCDESRASTASFGDLFDGAVGPAAAALTAIAAAAGGGGIEDLEALVGNSSLNTESPATGRRRFCDPLPLPEMLDSLYSLEQ